MNEEDESCIDDEVTILQSIFESELIVNHNESGHVSSVVITLHPATANDANTQYVKLQLQFAIPVGYPSNLLKVKFLSSRGLSDGHLSKLKQLLDDRIEELTGEPVLYEVIQIARENLTLHNVPSCPCPICLSSFMEFTDFLKTECYHYMHSYCMYKYVEHQVAQKKMELLESNAAQHNKKSLPLVVHEVPCPVCRVPVSFDLEALKTAPEPLDNQPSDIDLSSLKKSVEWMSNVYEKQRQNGGLIDLDEEKNKNLLSSIERTYAQSTQQSNDINTSRPSTTNTSRPSTTTSSSGESAPSSNSTRHNHRHPHRKKNFVSSGHAREKKGLPNARRAKASNAGPCANELRQNFGGDVSAASGSSQCSDRGNAGPSSDRQRFKPRFPFKPRHNASAQQHGAAGATDPNQNQKHHPQKRAGPSRLCDEPRSNSRSGPRSKERDIQTVARDRTVGRQYNQVIGKQSVPSPPPGFERTQKQVRPPPGFT